MKWLVVEERLDDYIGQPNVKNFQVLASFETETLDVDDDEPGAREFALNFAKTIVNVTSIGDGSNIAIMLWDDDLLYVDVDTDDPQSHTHELEYIS